MPLTLKNAALALTVAASLACGACQTDRHTTSDATRHASISIETASRNALAGDTLTFIARTKDTYGRDAKIRWNASGGSVDTEDEGRLARVRFTDPGTYSVRATLLVDGREIESDMIEVRVQPIR